MSFLNLEKNNDINYILKLINDVEIWNNIISDIDGFIQKLHNFSEDKSKLCKIANGYNLNSKIYYERISDEIIDNNITGFGISRVILDDKILKLLKKLYFVKEYYIQKQNGFSYNIININDELLEIFKLYTELKGDMVYFCSSELKLSEFEYLTKEKMENEV